MTIPVDVDQLAKVLGRFGPGYLLTLKPPQADGPAVKVHCVDPVFDDGRLLVPCEHRSAIDNAGQDPRVTIVWPPLVHHGHSSDRRRKRRRPPRPAGGGHRWCDPAPAGRPLGRARLGLRRLSIPVAQQPRSRPTANSQLERIGWIDNSGDKNEQRANSQPVEPPGHAGLGRQRARAGRLRRHGHPIPQRTGHPIPQRTGHPIPQRTRHPLPQRTGHPLPESIRRPVPARCRCQCGGRLHDNEHCRARAAWSG